MSGYRPIYTTDEDTLVLKIIIDSVGYYRIRGKSFWEDISNSGLIDRSWQSIKERFEKHVLPRINSYDISDIEKKNIELASYQLNLGVDQIDHIGSALSTGKATNNDSDEEDVQD